MHNVPLNMAVFVLISPQKLFNANSNSNFWIELSWKFPDFPDPLWKALTEKKIQPYSRPIVFRIILLSRLVVH